MKKLTKKGIAEIYDYEKSLNRNESKLLMAAREKIGSEQVMGYDVQVNRRTVVDYAYDLQSRFTGSVK